MASSSEEEMESCAPERKRSLLFCSHCDLYVSKSTYYRHRDAYFNPLLGTWDRVNEGCLTDNEASSKEEEVENGNIDKNII